MEVVEVVGAVVGIVEFEVVDSVEELVDVLDAYIEVVIDELVVDVEVREDDVDVIDVVWSVVVNVVEEIVVEDVDCDVIVEDVEVLDVVEIVCALDVVWPENRIVGFCMLWVSYAYMEAAKIANSNATNIARSVILTSMECTYIKIHKPFYQSCWKGKIRICSLIIESLAQRCGVSMQLSRLFLRQTLPRSFRRI